MPPPVIPTLGAQTMLKDPAQQLAYMLNFFAAAPRDATDTFRSDQLTISLVDIMSRYGYRRADVAAPIKDELSKCLIRIYGQGNVTVTVTTEDVDVSRYSIIISATAIVDNVPYTVAPTVTVDNGRLVFQ